MTPDPIETATTPVKTATTPVKTDAYVKVEAGAYNAYKGLTSANVGVLLGGEVKKGGTYAKAEVGYGTALKAGIEAGHEFDIGRNMGLELSGNAKYLKNTSESSFTSRFSVNGISTPTVRTEWHDGYKKLGASAMFNLKGKAGNVKVGLEGGYRANNAPDVTHNYTVSAKNTNIITNGEETITETTNINTKKSIMFKGNRSGAYVTPKVSAELNLGKNGHWALTANADRFEGSAGIKYTF